MMRTVMAPWSCWNLDLNFSIYFGVTDILCRQLTHCAGANGDWGSSHMLWEGGCVPDRYRRGAYRYPSNHFRGSSVPHTELLQRACCEARAEQGAVPAHHLDGAEWDTGVEECESMGGGGGEWMRPCSRLPLGHYACRQFKFLWTGTIIIATVRYCSLFNATTLDPSPASEVDMCCIGKMGSFWHSSFDTLSSWTCFITAHCVSKRGRFDTYLTPNVFLLMSLTWPNERCLKSSVFLL